MNERGKESSTMTLFLEVFPLSLSLFASVLM